MDTFGPGEPSAYCGHAGAYTEFVPVAHIVGHPGTDAMKANKIIHHSAGTGEFDMWHKLVKYISADTCVLLDPRTAPHDIVRIMISLLLIVNTAPTSKCRRVLIDSKSTDLL